MKTSTAAQTMVSGDWHVRAGNEEDFVKRWTEFLAWTRTAAPGFIGARLIRDSEDSRHYISFADWDSHEARHAWRGLPEFPSKMQPCRELCEDMRGTNYDVVASL